MTTQFNDLKIYIYRQLESKFPRVKNSVFYARYSFYNNTSKDKMSE